MLPETVEIFSILLTFIWFEMIQHSVLFQVINIDLIDASRNEQFDFIWEEVAEIVIGKDQLKPS